MEDKSINERKIDETVARCKKMLDEILVLDLVNMGNIIKVVNVKER